MNWIGFLLPKMEVPLGFRLDHFQVLFTHSLTHSLTQTHMILSRSVPWLLNLGFLLKPVTASDADQSPGQRDAASRCV